MCTSCNFLHAYALKSKLTKMKTQSIILAVDPNL